MSYSRIIIIQENELEQTYRYETTRPGVDAFEASRPRVTPPAPSTPRPPLTAEQIADLTPGGPAPELL